MRDSVRFSVEPPAPGDPSEHCTGRLRAVGRVFNTDFGRPGPGCARPAGGVGAPRDASVGSRRQTRCSDSSTSPDPEPSIASNQRTTVATSSANSATATPAVSLAEAGAAICVVGIDQMLVVDPVRTADPRRGLAPRTWIPMTKVGVPVGTGTPQSGASPRPGSRPPARWAARRASASSSANPAEASTDTPQMRREARTSPSRC
jgi:hypothetical protein